MQGSKQPENLGVHDGKLAACPDSPNCVSTQATDKEQFIAPLSFEGSTEELRAAIKEAIQTTPRAKLISEESDYIHAECRSLLLRFVDDLELWIDAENKQLHARSASRTGYSDLGVNRKRVEELFARLSN